MNRWSVRFVAPLSAFLVALFSQFSLAQEPSLKIIRLKGANVMVNIFDRIGREYATIHPDVRVVVAGGGTAAGFEAYCDRACDIVMASRKINEKEIQTTAVCGARLVEVPAGWECVAVVVNPASRVSELTVEQLGKLLTGELTQWNEVGGPEGPIVVVASPGYTGTAEFLRQCVMGDGYFTSEAVTKDRYFEILKEVQRKPNAIGYAGLTDAEFGVSKGMVKILAMRKDATSPAVRPSAQTLKDGSYPLRQPLYLYWGGPAASKDVRDFLEYFVKQVVGRP